MERTPWWRGNLPAETSSFIGREIEVRRLLKLLSDTPLITITGAGGVGKSRIAVKVAEESHDSYADGTWLVEPAGRRDGDLLAHTVAAVLGLREQPPRPRTGMLVEFLADKNLLLVLDACEHLTDACRGLVTEILDAAPRVRVIATSRQALGLPREVPVPIEPFPVPGPGAEERRTNDALRLFLDRAADTVPGRRVTGTDLAAAVRICRRLDGVPLAVELAAGRLRALPAPRLADHLEERFAALPAGPAPAAQRTLRTAIDCCHELCTPAERLLWARLSVFAGTFDTEAVRRVCEDEHLPDASEPLAGLAATSLLARVPGGYRQPDAIREYGRERLARLGDEDRLVRRHRHHYLDLARRADADWYGPRQEEWAARLDAAAADLRLALDSGSPASPACVELSGRLWILWSCLGRLNEGRHYMARSIEAAPAADPGLPRLLWADGCVAVARGELELGRRRAEAALSAALDRGDYTTAGHAQLLLACRSLLVGDLGEVGPAVELVREYFRRGRADTVDEPLALVTVATAHTWRGEFARAVAALEEARRLCDARGERWVRACGDYVLSIARLGLDRVAEAAEAARESLDAKWRFRDAAGVVLALDQLAVIAAVGGDGHRTARLQGAVARLRTTFGLRRSDSRGMSEPGSVAERTARQLLGDEAYDAAFAEGYDDLDSAIAYALA
ncbi:hypothetical protein GCM10010517_24640 [Streptosporangium fragile]|uniref:NB-ARC domain-containing protein n=1 Tax=Streptosporangium fragile TaxID=46186 RepID=A0ABP6IDK4_9ACTN